MVRFFFFFILVPPFVFHFFLSATTPLRRAEPEQSVQQSKLKSTEQFKNW